MDQKRNSRCNALSSAELIKHSGVTIQHGENNEQDPDFSELTQQMQQDINSVAGADIDDQEIVQNTSVMSEQGVYNENIQSNIFTEEEKKDKVEEADNITE